MSKKETKSQKEESLQRDLDYANKLMQEYKKAVDESTIFSIGDTKGKIIYANKQFLQVSGYELEELIGKPHSIVRNPKMPKELFAQMWKTIQSKKVWRGRVINKKKNGQDYHVEVTIVPILDNKGKIIEYAGIRNDITNLVLKEKELIELKDKQRIEDIQKALEIKTTQMFENIPFPSVLLNAQTLCISYANKAFNELFYATVLFDASKKRVSLCDYFSQENEYVFQDDFLSLFQRYELQMPHPQAAIKIDERLYEFCIGIKKLSDDYLVTLVPKQ